jgi:hypothetical protein
VEGRCESLNASVPVLDAHLDDSDSSSRAATVLAVARISRRAFWLFLVYIAVLGAVVLAGFLAEAVGFWAALLWGAALLGVAFIWVRQRFASRTP